MKKARFLLVLLLAAAVPARAGEKLSLLCTGWQPVYQGWEQIGAPASDSTARLLVHIDGDARTMTTSLPNAGEVLANLEPSNRYYLATMPLGRLVFNRSLDAVELSIDRVNGEGRFRYMVGETGYPAFSGTCVTAARPY